MRKDDEYVDEINENFLKEKGHIKKYFDGMLTDYDEFQEDIRNYLQWNFAKLDHVRLFSALLANTEYELLRIMEPFFNFEGYTYGSLAKRYSGFTNRDEGLEEYLDYVDWKNVRERRIRAKKIRQENRQREWEKRQQTMENNIAVDTIDGRKTPL